MRRRRFRRLGMVIAALAVMLPAVAFAAEPSAGEWPVATDAADVRSAPLGTRWVRTQPMLISALSASMGTPPRSVVDRYYGTFGATAKLLWQDGAAEVPGWQSGRAANPFITWLRSDGTSAYWDGLTFESTGLLIGGLEPGRPGRIGYQIGDEPQSITELNRIQSSIEQIRALDPGALLYTNLSVYAPNADAILSHWVSQVDADVLMGTDYFFDHLHYDALERYRSAAHAKGVPYWQYLNAYIGDESAGERLHSESDLRWQAMVGLVYGFTGHAWFIYQADGPKHPTATSGGGSVLFDGVGDWAASTTDTWSVVASINRELANLGPTMTNLVSTDVRLIPASHPDVVEPLLTTEWTPGAGGDPYLTAIRPADGEDPMEIPVGFFRDDDGERYTMVQNGRHTHSLGADEPPLPGADASGAIRLEFDFTGAPITLDRSRLEYLDPVDGDVKVLALSELPVDELPVGPSEDEEPVTEPPNERRFVEVDLRAGGVVLFKYADTIPFRTGPDPDGVAVVDPDQGIWHLRDRVGVRSFYYGNPGDVPFMGDWDCDGIDTPGLYRQSDGYVYLRNANTQGTADVRFFFGNPGDQPIAGDFNGDGCDTVSIYRPSEGRVYIIDRLGSGDAGLGAADTAYYLGDLGDRPFVGDFDGDGVDTIGLHRPASGQVFLHDDHAAGPADRAFFIGDTSDVVVAGSWGGAPVDTVGIFRPAEARFYLKFANESGPTDIDFLYGEETFLPITGRF